MVGLWLPLEILNCWKEIIIKITFLEWGGGELKQSHSLKIADGQAKGFPCPRMTHIENNKRWARTMELYKGIRFQESKFWGIKKSGE